MWSPQIGEGEGPLYLRVADAIEADIAGGRLSVGEKLPPHRDLAYRLSIGVGTVTKAYEEAERRGLIDAHVGRGSFVAEARPASSKAETGLLDLAMNTAPSAPTHARIPEVMNALRKRPGAADLFAYAPPLGRDADRRAGADWLRRVSGFERADGRRTICTLGAQHGMSLLLSVIAKPGATILCENLNYIGLKSLAQHQGYKLHGVAMDGEGLCPDALERAVRETGARILYTVPTLHNPTARIMSMARREAIAALARKHDLLIIEDDIYAHFATSLPICPIANLAPERTYLISGLSKAVAPGLRAGYLALPDESRIGALSSSVRATIFAPPGISHAVASLMIENGLAEDITAEVRDEIIARCSVAMGIIGQACEAPATPASLHLWLPLPELEAEKVTGRAMRAGLSLLPPGVGAVSSDAESGLRVSLGAVPDRDDLTRALNILREVLAGEAASAGQSLI